MRNIISTILQKPVVIIGLLALAQIVSAAEIRFSSTALVADTWRNDSAWDGGTQPTAADDVIFDYANTTTITSMALHTSPNDFYANSLTFGSASGPALGVFEFRNGNTGTASRNLFLTSGTITVASQVTGTQTMRSSQGKTSLFAVDDSFEVNNNSDQLFIINSSFSDNTAPASLTLTASAGGAITLGGINTHTGGTIINPDSNVTMNSPSAMGTGTVSVGSGSTFDIALNTDVSIAGLNDVAGAGGTVIRSNTNKARTLILNGGGTYDFSGALSVTESTSNGNFKIQIDGGGTQKLSGNSTYGGGTLISNGTLIANSASATGTGNVAVGALGVLGGTGSVASASTTAATAEFSPGDDGVGTLTVNGNLSLQNGAVFNFELGAVSDKIVVGGTLRGSTNAGDLVFNFSGVDGVSAGVAYTLFDYTDGSISGLDVTDFALSNDSISAGFVLDSAFGTNGWLIDTNSQLVQVRFSSTPDILIPEPASVAWLAGAVIFITSAGLRRRRLSP